MSLVKRSPLDPEMSRSFTLSLAALTLMLVTFYLRSGGLYTATR